jgi:hypothetical protein
MEIEYSVFYAYSTYVRKKQVKTPSNYRRRVVCKSIFDLHSTEDISRPKVLFLWRTNLKLIVGFYSCSYTNLCIDKLTPWYYICAQYSQRCHRSLVFHGMFGDPLQ